MLLRRTVEPRDALQQQVAQPAGELAAVTRGGEELLGEERVALGAGDDGVGHRRGQQGVGAGGEQRRQLVAGERTELERHRRAGASDAVGEPAHALGRGGLVRAVGGEQQHPVASEVVGEEYDEVERRRVGPVQIVEDEQHRRGAARSPSSARACSNACSRDSAARPQTSPRGRNASTNGW